MAEVTEGTDPDEPASTSEEEKNAEEQRDASSKEERNASSDDESDAPSDAPPPPPVGLAPSRRVGAGRPGVGLRGLHPVTRLRLAVASGAVLFAVVLFAACGGCGKRVPGEKDTTAAAQASAVAPDAGRAITLELDAASLRDPLLWGSAKDGDVEDLAELAAHEGAMGLVEATTEPALRPTALRAMGYARGWAQLPLLAKVASGKNDDEARLALEATLELAARPRRSEDPEDAEELREGCDTLLVLARDVARPRARRVAAVRALRMMPCPPGKAGPEELPTDVDAK